MIEAIQTLNAQVAEAFRPCAKLIVQDALQRLTRIIASAPEYTLNGLQDSERHAVARTGFCEEEIDLLERAIVATFTTQRVGYANLRRKAFRLVSEQLLHRSIEPFSSIRHRDIGPHRYLEEKYQPLMDILGLTARSMNTIDGNLWNACHR